MTTPVDRFKASRDSLAEICQKLPPFMTIQHVDVTCDGCDVEPIIGNR